MFAQSGYWWNEIDIVIENKCTDRLYIRPGTFRLYLSSQPSTENAQEYLPTTRGLEYQPNRLTAGWLEPGDKTSGRLIFEEKLTEDEEAGRAGQYRILCYYVQSSCPIKYEPYWMKVRCIRAQHRLQSTPLRGLESRHDLLLCGTLN